MSRKYNASPIIEAVCDFRFISEAPWDLTIPGLLYEQVQNHFPKRNQIAQINVGIATNEGFIGYQTGTTPLIQFLHEDEKSLLQIGQNILSVNQLKPYTSWQQFQPIISEGFQAYSKVAKPTRLASVALRYINRIELTYQSRLEEYLNFRPFLGQELSQELRAFVVGVQIPYEEERDILTIQLTTVSVETPDKAPMMLDLTYTRSQAEELQIDTILEWINIAHERIENTFEACITDQLRIVFKEMTEK